MYTYTFASGVKAELVFLNRDRITGIIKSITWQCSEGNAAYGAVIISQTPTTHEFYVSSADRFGGASWLTSSLDGLTAHCSKHFADVKAQDEFFKTVPGTHVDGASEWEV